MKNLLILLSVFMMNIAYANGPALNGPNSLSINEGGGGCPGQLVLIPLPGVSGPAVIYCDGDIFPEGYYSPSDQVCAQAVVDNDPFCLTTQWDDLCAGDYINCVQGLGCSEGVDVYLPDPTSGLPAVVLCAPSEAPAGYTLAVNQECALAVIAYDTYCLGGSGGFWDPLCQDTYDNCVSPGPTCDDGIQNGDETGVDCGGEFCLPCDCQVLLPGPTITGNPAVIWCPGDEFPEGYVIASNQACAQTVVDSDPFCLGFDGGYWDDICAQSYYDCVFGCTFGSVIYLPDVVGDGPAVVVCEKTPGPVGYTAAENQVCAQAVIEADPYCITNFWDGICQGAYDACNAPCQVPFDLDVVEIDFGGANARVNATWINPEGTTYCEVRGGRISPASYAAGEPEFANINNTQVITQTNGSTVLFNVVLYNNPNVPFTVGQRYGYEVRCDCADGSGLSDWANITPEATFVVPTPPEAAASGTKMLNAGVDGMSVYPNPTDGIVNIELLMVEEGSVEIILTNALGQTVKEDRSSGKDILNRMDVSDLEAGIYMLSVRTPSGMITERLIIK